MAFDVWSELVELRERIAVMETTLLDIRRLLDKLEKQPAPSGSLIVPVSVIIVLVQAVTEAIKHFV
jgi:hypothetical protein